MLFWWIFVKPDVDPELRVHSSQIYLKKQETAQTPSLAIGLGDDALGGLFSTKNQKKSHEIAIEQVVLANFA